jgi:UDP-N-acetylmuramate dehydrogenase
MSDLTTLCVGGPVGSYTRAETADAVVEAVRASDAAARPLLVVAGGSNLLVSDSGFPGEVVHIATRGIEIVDDTGCGGVTVRVAAGEVWDSLVEHAVASGWVGIEALSGIPGSVGATPVQNVGAYGQDVAQTIAQVRTFDRQERAIRTFAVGDCGFGYRTSAFKQAADRFVVLDVTFQFGEGALGRPIAYGELATALGIQIGERAPMADVRDAVLALRRSKGMVLDPADDDTRSAGSFFMNPVLTADAAAGLPADAPRWPQPDGTVKTSAAWLIEHAGFTKGFALSVDAAARISTKHTLALTTRSDAVPPARAADIVALARVIRAGVHDATGITLVPEPRLVGLALDPPSRIDSDTDPTADAATTNAEAPA